MADWNNQNIGWKPIFDCVGMIPDEGGGPTFLKEGAMKILTVCQGGNSRSVGCAFLLKYKYGYDALACGWEKNSIETLKMLCKWADKIIIMQSAFRQYIPEYEAHKLEIIDVGPDIWCNSLHPDLLMRVDEKLSLLVERL